MPLPLGHSTIKRQEDLGTVVVTDCRVDPAGHKKVLASEIDKWRAGIKAASQYAD